MIKNKEIIDVHKFDVKESSLVLKRMVYEGIMKEGGIMKADISNEMIDYIGRSHRLYQVAQKESRENQTLFPKKRLERKRLNDEINTLKGAKKTALDCTANKVTEIDSKIKFLEEELHKI